MTHIFPYKVLFLPVSPDEHEFEGLRRPRGHKDPLLCLGCLQGQACPWPLWEVGPGPSTTSHLAAMPHSNLSWHHLIKLQMWSPATWFLISFRACEVLAGGELGVDAESQRARGVGSEHPCTSYTQQLPHDVHSQQVENGALEPTNPGLMPTSASG